MRTSAGDATGRWGAHEGAHGTVLVVPVIESTTCDRLDVQAAFFTSLRGDYPTFDDWFTRVAQQRRPALAVFDAGDLIALTILKAEQTPDLGLRGPATKICTLKVDEKYRRRGIGRTLLRRALLDAEAAGHHTAYLPHRSTGRTSRR